MPLLVLCLGAIRFKPYELDNHFGTSDWLVSIGIVLSQGDSRWLPSRNRSQPALYTWTPDRSVQSILTPFELIYGFLRAYLASMPIFAGLINLAAPSPARSSIILPSACCTTSRLSVSFKLTSTFLTLGLLD